MMTLKSERRQLTTVDTPKIQTNMVVCAHVAIEIIYHGMIA